VPGETLADIAHRYSTSLSALSAANQGAALDAGDLLVIPTVSRVAERTAVARAHGTRSRRLVASHRGPAHPSHKLHTAPYRTASLTTRHRAAAN
jgi:LysM domain